MREAAVLSVLLLIKTIKGSRLSSLESLLGFGLFFNTQLLSFPPPPPPIILSVKLKGNMKHDGFEGYLGWFWLAVELQRLVGPTEIIPKADVTSWLHMESVYWSLSAQIWHVGTISRVGIHTDSYIMIQRSSSVLLSTNSFLAVCRTEKLKFRKKCKYLVKKVGRKKIFLYSDNNTLAVKPISIPMMNRFRGTLRC